MMALLIQKNTLSSSYYLSPEEVLGYQPSDEPYFFVIYQYRVPVGFSEGFIGEKDEGGKTTYHLTEQTRMLLASGGYFKEVDMFLKTELDAHFALRSFEADVLTEKTRFKVEGKVKDKILNLNIESGEEKITKDFSLEHNSALPVTLAPFLASRRFEQNTTYTLDLLDPLTLGTNTAKIKLLGNDKLFILGKIYEVRKFEITLKEIVSYIYLDKDGEKIREDLGSGIIAVRETKERVREIEQFLDAFKGGAVN